MDIVVPVLALHYLSYNVISISSYYVQECLLRMSSLECVYPINMASSVQRALIAVDVETRRRKAMKEKEERSNQAQRRMQAESTERAASPKPRRPFPSREVAAKRPRSVNTDIVSVLVNDTDEFEEKTEEESAPQTEKIVKNYMGSKGNVSEKKHVKWEWQKWITRSKIETRRMQQDLIFDNPEHRVLASQWGHS